MSSQPGLVASDLEFLSPLRTDAHCEAAVGVGAVAEWGLNNMTAAEEDRRVWRPDVYGSTLFLMASAVAILAFSTAPMTTRGSVRRGGSAG